LGILEKNKIVAKATFLNPRFKKSVIGLLENKKYLIPTIILLYTNYLHSTTLTFRGADNFGRVFLPNPQSFILNI